MQFSFTKILTCLFAFGIIVSLNAQVPMNNECSGAMDVSSLFGQTVGMPQTSGLLDNTNATTEASDPATGWECFGEPDGAGAMPSLENTLWFSFVGDGGSYYITTVECSATNYITDSDTQIAIYTGGCDDLTGVACNEDGPDATNNPPSYPAGLDFQTENGVTYYMLIDGFSLNGTVSTGEFCVQVTQNAPVDVVDCASANSGTATGAAFVCNGETTEFTLTDVVVPNVAEAGFFWVVSSADISGSLNPLEEASHLGEFDILSNAYTPVLVNDYEFLSVGSYFFTPVSFAEATLDADGNVDLSDACVFTANSVAVTLLPEIAPLSVDIMGTDAVDGAANGSASVAVTGGSESYVYEWSNGANTAMISGLAAGDYSCTVTDETGCPDEVVVNVSIDATVHTNDLVLGAAVNIIPNPSKDITQITFDLNEAMNLNIRVVDVLGKVVYTENHSNAINGASTVNVSSWSNGVYFVQFSNENRQYTQRLIVQK